MRIIFIGCVRFSYEVLKHLLPLPEARVVGVITKRESQFNADFCSLEPLALQSQVPYFIAAKDNQEEMVSWLKSLAPDVVYCFGWSTLLKKDILAVPRLGVIGYHPAALPQNRGRHPIIWALVLGLPQTASTFFFMDEETDSGDILSQEFVEITNKDDASSLYDKLMKTALGQVSTFTSQLASGTFERSPQDERRANYWRKRSKRDGQIDWRMSTKGIANLVRALYKPYVGAHCVFNEIDVKIWKVEIVEIAPSNIEPGKVLQVKGNKLLVKTGDGIIRIVEHEFNHLPEEGAYL